ncbi:CIB1 protein [Camponotus japonicus]
MYRVFSSKQDRHLSFEDILDFCSVFSANCPQGVRAFEIFDFDGDYQVSLDNLIKAVQRQAGSDERGQIRIDRQRAENIARMVGVHSCCAFSTKDGIGERLILLPKAAFCCNKFPVVVVDFAAESR